jgi:hypothetical protein
MCHELSVSSLIIRQRALSSFFGGNLHQVDRRSVWAERIQRRPYVEDVLQGRARRRCKLFAPGT